MIESLVLLTSGITAFFAHNFGERYITDNGQKQVRIIVKGYQLHHSVFGALTILIAIVFLSGTWAVIFFGYGVGNIWQHKITHNRVNENGLVFISKLK
jgi:hypothetical protein